MLELKVTVININLESNHEILKKCRPMYEYSFFIEKIREYQEKEYLRDISIIQAIEDCKKAGIMVDFLKEHGSEVSNMLFTEFNMEDALEVRGEERFAEGKAEGKAEGEEKMLTLFQAFIKDGRQHEIPRLAEDSTFREDMLKKLKL